MDEQRNGGLKRMNIDKIYGREYFEGIYTHLNKEKALVLNAFFDLLCFKASRIDKILDLGCGQGEFLNICQGKGLVCYGVDASSYAIEKAKKVKGKFFKLNLEKDKLPFSDESFDAVTAFDLIEHLKQPEFVFSEAVRVLRKGGLFFITSPNADFILANFFGRFIPGDPTHVNIQGKDYWLKKLKAIGFKTIEIKSCLLFGFPPSLNWRYYLRKLRLPVLVRPIFSPIYRLNPELFIFARK